MNESVEQARQLVGQAGVIDQSHDEWQDLYYTATYLRGRGDDPFADDVWEALDLAHKGEASLPLQFVRKLRMQLKQKLYTQWQALYDDAVVLKENGYDPFSSHGWEEMLAAKDTANLDTLALTVHYLQPSLARTRNEVIQELTRTARMLKEGQDDPLSPEEWEKLLAPDRTTEEEAAFIQVLMPRVVDTLHTLLEKLDLTAQQFQAAGYPPFISHRERLRRAIERRTLRELATAIRVFPRELEEHIRLRISYWSDKAATMGSIREQLEIDKNQALAGDFIAIYQTGLAKLKSLDRKGSYGLDSLHTMVLAISQVESSWGNLIELSQSEERLVRRLRWATGGVIVAFLILVVAATAIAPRLEQVNEPLPLLGIPPSVLLWSFLGSFVALLMRFIRRKFWAVSDLFKWFLARSLVGFIMGAILYLVVIAGFFVFGTIIGSPTSTLSVLPRPEIVWLLAFVCASNDRIAERVLSIVTGQAIRLFESINEPGGEKSSGNERTNEAATEPQKSQKSRSQRRRRTRQTDGPGKEA
jgi:hypothetical protein